MEFKDHHDERDEPFIKKIRTDEETKVCIEEEVKEKSNLSCEDVSKTFAYSLEADILNMLDEVDFVERLPTPTERYFTPYYMIDVQKPGDDICIKVHSNRICVIALAPSHTIFQDNKTIESINFKVSKKLDRMQNAVSGKAKHGAQALQNNSNICSILCTDGSDYTIKCCMVGKLVEANDQLINRPELLKEEQHKGGYIAIILPNLKHLDKTIEQFLTQEQYNIAIEKRKNREEV